MRFSLLSALGLPDVMALEIDMVAAVFFYSFVVLVADGMRPVDHSALHCHWSGFPFAA